MLSSISGSGDPGPPIAATFAGSMSALLFDDTLEDVDMEKPSVDVSKYLDECVESVFSRVGSASSVSASPRSDHTTVSRTSSDEGCTSSITSSYTLPVTFDPFSPVESHSSVILAQSHKSNVSVEDFPYEDVLSLENALKEAVGDSFKSVAVGEEKEDIHWTEDKFIAEASLQHEKISTSRALDSSPIPSISNIFPKVSHRVMISPTTTRILTEDVLRKKHAIPNSKPEDLTLSTKCLGDHLTRVSISSPGLESRSSVLPRSRSFSLTLSSQNNAEGERSEATQWTPEFSVTATDFPGCPEDTSTDGKNTENPKAGEQGSKRIPPLMQKQPLPPEGYKITRYPLQQKEGLPNPGDEQREKDQTEIINELRHQLRKARMETGQHMRQVEDWKATAKHTFEAARKIRAQMELERSRADQAESRIAQLTAHFKTKAAAKARARSLGASKGSSSPGVNSPQTGEDNGTKKRISSEVPAILSTKRRRTEPPLDQATKSLASWLMSSQASEKEVKSSDPSSSKTASENIFGNSKQKDNLVYTPQINSGVRLALRAKVCSASGESLNTAYDLMKQTQLLLADLPVVPASNQASLAAPDAPKAVLTRKNRWSSVDSVHTTVANSSATSSVAGPVATISHSLSESSLKDKT